MGTDVSGKETYMKKYIIKYIYHNGRKGERWKPHDNPKYEDILGSTIALDEERIVLYSPVKFLFKGNKFFDYWYTTPVLEVTEIFDYDGIFLETTNAIYELREVKKDGENN